MASSLKERVERRLEELNRNPFEAARIGQLERSFVNDILIGKKVSVQGSSLPKLASALDWTVASLLGDDPVGVESTRVIRVRGLVGAGAEIFTEVEQIGHDGLDEIELAVAIDPTSLAFRVKGDSMWPRYDDGDVVICGREGTDLSDIVDWEAAVRTGDGRRFLKRLRAGSKKGLFDLESHNAPPLRDVEIEWASQVAHVVRVGHWKPKRSPLLGRRLINRMSRQ